MHTKQELAKMFDEDYFERGLETGKSMYTNYHWMPKITFKTARAFINEMNPKKTDTIIDYGCAKGFFVKALRKLGYQAYGVDISKYAVENADPEIKQYVSLSAGGRYDIGFTKDVLEHSFADDDFLKSVLAEMRSLADRWLVVVPVGFEEHFIIPAYEKDPSHIVRQPSGWWIKMFKKNNFDIRQTKYRVDGIKDNWFYGPKGDPKGNLFLELKSKN